MRLLRWCPWYDEAEHAKVEQELSALEREQINLAARATILEAEIFPYGKQPQARREAR